LTPSEGRTLIEITVELMRATGEIARIVGQLVVHVGMRDEGRRRAQQQHMVVAGADEGIDGDNAVATRTVLHHDRLTPARGELFGNQARADVGA
jgi:hypothetical protein